MKKEIDKKHVYERWGALKAERSSWIDQWKEISDFLLPRTGRFLVSDTNDGKKRFNKIIDSTGTKALNVLSSGMMAGVTSPSRPWFRLTTSNPELDESHAVKKWLADVTQLMQMIFQRSGTYRALHSIYDEAATYGVACNLLLDDFDTVIRHYPLTIGEYALAANYKNQIDTMYREFKMTASQVVGEFGYENCSRSIQQAYDRAGTKDQWFTIIHAIEPREIRDVRKRDSANMAYASAYFEESCDKPLRNSGFRRFPALAPRWLNRSGDVYGNSPGMSELGNLKQLQELQLQKARVIAYKANPPIMVPISMKGKGINTLPGGTSFYEGQANADTIRTAFQVPLDLEALAYEITDTRQQIDKGFYVDIFLMLTNIDRTGMTATEIAERHEEKLLVLGPVLESMHTDLLEPLIDLTFQRMTETGVLPPPPQEMQGQELNIEFVSMMAQAQRAVATNSVDRFIANLGTIASMKPEVLDKLNGDEWVDRYADMTGVDPNFIVSGPDVALIRKQRAEAQAQAQQAAMMQQMADSASKLGGVKTEEPNALTDLMSQMPL